ncbi:MAG: hypothetical protein JXN65_09825 [Clostridia bacterium]|nr:hypothetical protein [Clostridia bacterium]
MKTEVYGLNAKALLVGELAISKKLTERFPRRRKYLFFQVNAIKTPPTSADATADYNSKCNRREK